MSVTVDFVERPKPKMTQFRAERVMDVIKLNLGTRLRHIYFDERENKFVIYTVAPLPAMKLEWLMDLMQRRGYSRWMG